MTTALIDGDIAAYRAAAACQHMIQWADDEDPMPLVNHAEAAKSTITTIRLWAEAAGCSKIIVALTGNGNFRKHVLPTYKSNRSGVARPLALHSVREAVRQEFNVVMVDGLEADDVLGIWATTPKARGKHVVISTDKDLRTIPGVHFNPTKDKQPVFVTEAEANRYWFTQALTGDAADGYRGCPGIGPKKAEKLLAPWDGLDLVDGVDAVYLSFMAAHNPPSEGCDAALQMLRVARILRHGDYDKRDQSVLLWHPTTPERLPLASLSQSTHK